MLRALAMANRKTSLLLQLGTVAALAGGWLLTRRYNKKERCADKQYRYCIPTGLYAPLTLALLVADLYAIPAVLRGKLLISADEFAAIHPNLVPWHDRHALSFIGSRHEHYRRISDRVLQALIALPFILLTDPRIRRDWRSMAMLYAWLHALTYTIYSFSPLGPAFVDKYRPVVYYNDLPEAIRNPGNNRNARFSGHTANGACSVFFLAKVLNDYYPKMDRTGKYGLYVLAYAIPLLLGWLRMKSLKHFPSDVLQAVVIGGACGVAIPELYKRD